MNLILQQGRDRGHFAGWNTSFDKIKNYKNDMEANLNTKHTTNNKYIFVFDII